MDDFVGKREAISDGVRYLLSIEWYVYSLIVRNDKRDMNHNIIDKLPHQAA